MKTALLIITVAVSLAVADQPTTAQQYTQRGMDRLAEAQVDAALADFDKAIELDARAKPFLWQRGLALYYAGRFADGAGQFELHQRVNPNDVENAAWHFICVAKAGGAGGVDAARKKLIEIDTARDTRAPMKQIYAYYAGKATADDVLKAADSAKARMYAHLYLGLYAEATGDADGAKTHMLKSAAEDAGDNYMQKIAKAHVKLRGWGSD